MNYRKELIHAINQYDGTEEKFINLRDIVCIISDKKDNLTDPLIRELLFIASQKLRVFGYNVLNELNTYSIIPENSISYLYKNLAINELYTSETGVLLDKNQKMVVDIYDTLEKKRLLVSAPTSFGKTFILRELIYFNRQRYKNIILIFPTISLLNENVESFINFIENMKIDYNIISNTHMEVDYSKNNIFILTPERVLKVLNDHPDLTFDFFFMDEIYKIDNFFNTTNDGDIISENERDAVFRLVLYLLSKKITDYYLAAPYLNLDNVGEGFKKFIEDNNIYPIQINTEVVKKEHIISWNNQVDYDGLVINFKNNNKIRKMIDILNTIKANGLGPTIVYAESISKVTKLARRTLNLFEENNEPNDKVKDFIDHLIGRYSVNYKGTKTHTLWTMIDMLKRGIATHHGAFPKYIQKEILDLFNEGYITTLFSTTSITEGVNTKAKNVIFYGKRKGKKELKNFDIKNINGRAGRYHHFFLGRIFYLDQDIYEKLKKDEDILDFITFSDKELPVVDLDNADKDDITQKNAAKKDERDALINSYNIDESVFIKNRLIDRLKQIELIKLLDAKSNAELKTLVRQCSRIKAFIESSTIYTILGYFKDINLLSDYEFKSLGKIVSDYSKVNGVFELFKYHLDKYELIDKEKVDTVYVKVFSDIRNIVEFKVPKYLSVFESILKYVCSLPNHNINTENLAFSSIIKFYELGVRTQFGMFLAEYGFPITTIKHLEREIYTIMNNDIEEIIYNFDKYREMFAKHLDSYENRLINNILIYASKMKNR